MTLGGREKCIVAHNSRPNTRELKFKGSIDYVTVMPVVSATGQVYTPVIVLPGVNACYRKSEDGTHETPKDFLSSPCYLYMREVPVVNGDIFIHGHRTSSRKPSTYVVEEKHYCSFLTVLQDTCSTEH